MNTFPHLSDEGMEAVLLYIENASQGIDSNLVPNYRVQFDSCARYLRARDSIFQRYGGDPTRRRDSLIQDNGNRIVINRYDDLGRPATPITLNLPDSVDVPVRPAIYYQFEINTFGWYNVDLLLKGSDGVENSELKVLVKGEYATEADVFLVIPSVKTFAQGGPLAGQTTEFGFLTDDGKIPLPQGVKAYILCLGEYKGQPFFGKLQWTIGLSQELTIEPEAMSKKAIERAIAQLRFDRLTVNVKDSKNADQIRETDKIPKKADRELRKIAYLKPRYCDCDCRSIEKRDTARVGY